MIHHVWSRIASPVPFAVALLALACHPGVAPLGLPLYSSVSAAPLPRTAVAELMGPIGRSMGESCSTGRDLRALAGCRVVELDQRYINGDNLSSGVYLSRRISCDLHAIHSMKAGASYIIRPAANFPGSGGDNHPIQISAWKKSCEREGDGKLNPMKSNGRITVQSAGLGMTSLGDCWQSDCRSARMRIFLRAEDRLRRTSAPHPRAVISFLRPGPGKPSVAPRSSTRCCEKMTKPLVRRPDPARRA